MADCFIYDHVRTPRGKGKASGKLHGVTPVELAKTALTAIADRNELDTAYVDDVILGCVDPVKEQGSNIARIAALYSGYAQTTPGVTVSRFCSSGLEAVNLAAAQVMAGQCQLMVAGGVEHMGRVGMGASGGSWSTDPAVAFPTYFVPQGISADLIATLYGHSRDDVDSYSVESQKRAAASWEAGYFSGSVVPVKDQNGVTILDHDEHMRPDDDRRIPVQAQGLLQGHGRELRIQRRRHAEVPRDRVASTTCITPATHPASWMVPPPYCSAPRRWATSSGSSRARACAPSRRSAPSRPSC